MPITITNPVPPGPIGPGMTLTWQSDFIGPLPTGTLLNWIVRPPGDESHEVMGGTVQNITSPGGALSIALSRSTPLSSGTRTAVEGSNVTLETQLVEPGHPAIDSGAQTFVWSNGSLAVSVQELTQGSSSSGLTDLQALQLQQTQQSTWPQHLVDQLTLQALGTGSASAPVAGNLTTPCFGVIVRITSVPAELQPQTPDGLYWVKTLASVLVFRGSDIWLRVPIHTPSKLINLWVEGLALGLADAVLAAGWLLDLTIQVFFLEGVTGEVFLMRVP